jgi:osmotically-inducible protein OsmY
MQLVRDDSVGHESSRDEILRERVVEWFTRRPSLRDIKVAVVDGIVMLEGSITSPADRALAIDLALDAGADEVQDNLTLKWPMAAQQFSE